MLDIAAEQIKIEILVKGDSLLILNASSVNQIFSLKNMEIWRTYSNSPF